jgi:hypothetical protein
MAGASCAAIELLIYRPLQRTLISLKNPMTLIFKSSATIS